MPILDTLTLKHRFRLLQVGTMMPEALFAKIIRHALLGNKLQTRLQCVQVTLQFAYQQVKPISL